MFKRVLCLLCLLFCGILLTEVVFFAVETTNHVEVFATPYLELNASVTAVNGSRKRVARDALVEVPCQKKSSRQLRALLGPAYNRHYMAIFKPVDFYANEPNTNPFEVHPGYSADVHLNYDDDVQNIDKRVTSRNMQDNVFSKRQGQFGYARSRDVDLDPSNLKSFNFSRAHYAPYIIRGVENLSPTYPLPKILPWLCPWYVRWIDMGEDTFPKYMRSVTCSSQTCWFDRMTCEARAFVVVVLKRKKSKCFAKQHIIEETFPLHKSIGKSKLPQELQEEWVFEERAANFCCECILKPPNPI